MEDYIVQTTSGQVKGHLRGQTGIVDYLGIPFAQPPIGDLRFRRAREIEPWDGVLDAKSYGAPSIQMAGDRMIGSEDCLTLNIFAPEGAKDLPVMIWIHGGGYNTGNATDDLTRGDAFVKEGIVFAAIQYRLGVLGFYDFSTYPGCEEFESNCGVSDQILGLKWLHENIAAFGGDPQRVTIFGESAGGASVVNMMAIPSVEGYFQQAIAESPLPNCIVTHEMARENINLFLKGMGWTEADLPKLRTMEPAQFQKGNVYVFENNQYKHPGMFCPGPIQDDLIPIRPIDAIRGGSAKGVKLIIGTNRNEGTMFVHPEKTGFPNSWSMITQMFEDNGHASALPEIIRYYHPSHGTPNFDDTEGGDPFAEFATDWAFQMPSLKVADAQKGFGDTWMYRYEFITESGKATGLKASHAFELPCVFGVREHSLSDFVFDGEPHENFDALTAQIQRRWIRFVKKGDPDPENWEKFTGPCSPVLIFDRNTRQELLDRSVLMKIWADLRFYEG